MFKPWYVRRDEWALFWAGMLPNWLVYWAGVRMITHATTGEHSAQVVPELTAMDALKRWAEEKCKP